MTEEEAKPRCPICEETFDVDDVKTLEMHVEAHLATNLYCPVCNAAFGIDKRENYQNHVQVRPFLLRPESSENIPILLQEADLCFSKQNVPRNLKIGSKQSIVVPTH
jgi:hypothetical protein